MLLFKKNRCEVRNQYNYRISSNHHNYPIKVYSNGDREWIVSGYYPWKYLGNFISYKYSFKVEIFYKYGLNIYGFNWRHGQAFHS